MTLKMNFNVLCVFVLLAAVISLEDVHLMQQRNILCRNCGSDVTLSDTLIAKSSPNSRYSFNDTLFNKDQVLVQVFATDLFFHYSIITFTYSTCVPTGEWEESTWFPGYLWKPCVCPDCGAYIGFVFEPINRISVEPSTTFYGLILTSLISEHCKYNQYWGFGIYLWCYIFLCLVPFNIENLLANDIGVLCGPSKHSVFIFSLIENF